MATVRIIDADREDRRQRITIITLFVIGALGISYLVFDYLRIVDRVSIPEDVNKVDPIVQQWEQEGLVTSFDAQKAVLTVNEEKWDERKKDEKVGIIVQLARYCAKKNNTPNWSLKVIGNRSMATLGEMGQSGLVIQ